jgi:hypothetical protein
MRSEVKLLFDRVVVERTYIVWRREGSVDGEVDDREKAVC